MTLLKRTEKNAPRLRFFTHLTDWHKLGSAVRSVTLIFHASADVMAGLSGRERDTAHLLQLITPLLIPPLYLIPLSCLSLIAFTALLISQIGLIDWIWFLWIEQLYWVAFFFFFFVLFTDGQQHKGVNVCYIHTCGNVRDKWKLPSLVPLIL